MPETPTTTPAPAIVFPPGRYGRRRDPRPARRWLVALGAACVAVLAAVVGTSLFRAYGDGDYSASVTAFTDITDTQIVVTFLVRLPEGKAAKCVVRARDASGAEAGRAEIVVVPGPDASRTVASYRLITRTRPVTGEVQGCRPA